MSLGRQFVIRRADPLIAVLVLLGALASFSFGISRSSLSTRALTYWTLMATVHVFLMVSAWSVSRLSPPGDSAEARATRRLWQLCSFTGISYLCGDLLMLADLVTRGDLTVAAGGTNAQTAMVAVGTGALTFGLFTFPANAPSAEARSRLHLDVATVMAAASTFGLLSVEVPPGPVGLRWAYDLTATILVSPGLFLVAIFAVVKLMLGGRAPFTRAAGLVCGAAALLQTALQVVPAAHYESPHDGPWLMGANVLSSTLLAIGVRIQELQARRHPQGVARAPRRPYSSLPYVAMVSTWAVSCAVLAVDGLSRHGWTMLAGAMLTTALVIGRQVTAFRHIAELLSERDALTAKLTGLAFRDMLTGLGNRALFMRELSEGLAAGPVTVFLVDLDDFKPVNDEFGHAAGDQLLIEVGARLRARVREQDTVARLGGDEFAVLVRDLGPDGRAVLADDLSRALHGTVTLGAAEVPLRASVGAATGDAAVHDPDSLLHAADMAMYAVKNGSRATPAGVGGAPHHMRQRRPATPSPRP